MSESDEFEPLPPDQKKELEASIFKKFQGVSRQVFTDLALGVSLCMAFQNRAMLQGLDPDGEEFQETIEDFKDSFIGRWREAVESSNNDIRVRCVDTGEFVSLESLQVDKSELKGHAIDIIETRIRFILGLNLRAKDLEAMFENPWKSEDASD